MIKVNLQRFAEDDVILPDDFQPAPPQAEEPIEQQPEVNTDTPTEEPKQDQTEVKQPESPKVKLKFNHEEKEYSLDDVVPLAQKGLNYDKLQERLRSLETSPALPFVESQAKKFGMTVEQYVEAVRQQEEKDRLNELIQSNIPEEYAKEIIDNRKFREKYEAEQKARQQQEKQNAEYREFLDSFPDTKPEEISQETWDKVAKGTPLKYAFMEQKYADMQKQLQVKTQNETNSKKAVVSSVTAHGSVETAAKDPFEMGFDSI